MDDIGRVRFIVGADGPTSKVARALSLGVDREFLFGIEAEAMGAALPEPDRLHCFLDRRLARGYIGWAFDGVGVTQIGLATRQRRTGRGGRSRIARLTYFHRGGLLSSAAWKDLLRR